MAFDFRKKVLDELEYGAPQEEEPLPGRVVDVPEPAEHFTGPAVQKPAQRGVMAAPEALPTDSELATAREMDAEARRRFFQETALRQAISAISLTPVQQTLTERDAGEEKSLRSRRLAYAQIEGRAALSREQARLAAEKEAQRLKEKKADEEQQERFHRENLTSRKEEAGATRALAAAGFDLRKSEVERQATEAEEKKVAGLPVNIRPVSGFTPSADSIKEVTTSVNANNELKLLAKQFKELIGKPKMDLLSPNSTERRRLNSIASQMTIAAKNVGGLGQITQGDQALIDSIRPSPDLFSLIVRNPASFQGQLDQLVKWGDTKQASVMADRFEFAGASKPSAQKPGRMVRNKTTGEVRYLNDDGTLGEVVK